MHSFSIFAIEYQQINMNIITPVLFIYEFQIFNNYGPTYWFPFLKEANLFSHFSNQTYVVGTQKNRLNETVLLSTQNI